MAASSSIAACLAGSLLPYDQALEVFFACNRRPAVLGSNQVTWKTAEKFAPCGVRFIGIGSNSKETHAENSFDRRIEQMKEKPTPGSNRATKPGRLPWPTYQTNGARRYRTRFWYSVYPGKFSAR